MILTLIQGNMGMRKQRLHYHLSYKVISWFLWNLVYCCTFSLMKFILISSSRISMQERKLYLGDFLWKWRKKEKRTLWPAFRYAGTDFFQTSYDDKHFAVTDFIQTSHDDKHLWILHFDISFTDLALQAKKKKKKRHSFSYKFVHWSGWNVVWCHSLLVSWNSC